MSDEPTEYDPNRTSQAEGEDAERPDHEIVLEAQGKPSEAEGEDPDDPAEVHEVRDQAEPD